MNKIKLILIMMFAFASFGFAQVTYDSVASYTAKTTIGTTDIFPFQTPVSNKYTWRRLTGLSLWNFVDQVIDTNNTALLAASNSWDGINNFDGATFNSGAHGGVTFSDSVNLIDSYNLADNLIPPAQPANSNVGLFTRPFSTIYANAFVVPNAGGTDSASISYDEDNESISISKLNITQSVNIDSGGSFRTFTYTPHSYQITDGGDTVLTLSSSDRYSLILLELPANMATKGISAINVEGATIGMVLGIINYDESYSVKFVDYVGNDDNLYIGSDFTASFLDYIELLCIDDGVDSQQWILRFNQDNN